MPTAELTLPIETDRLVIREFAAGDAEAVYGYARHDDFVRYLEIPRQTRSSIEGFVQRCLVEQNERPRREYNLAISLAGSKQPIGGVSLHLPSPRLRKAGIGYALDPSYWGRGLASEAVEQVIEAGFRQLRLVRIYAFVHAANGASRRLAEKLGMTQEGLLRLNTVTLEGEPADEYIYGLLAEEYEAWLAASPGGEAKRR